MSQDIVGSGNGFLFCNYTLTPPFLKRLIGETKPTEKEKNNKKYVMVDN